MWCVPEIDEEYKRRMFDVLDTYERPYDPLLPVVCLDEKLVELRSDKRDPIGMHGGRLIDFEYKRMGTANLFVATEPKGGNHFVQATDRRTSIDFAQCLKWLSDKYPDVIKIHLVMDNLNTHKESSLIKAYGQQEGSRLWGRFHVHYTPKHASWLNQAEIAIGVTSCCILKNRRFPTKAVLKRMVTKFWRKRTQESWKINWNFKRLNANAWLSK